VRLRVEKIVLQDGGEGVKWELGLALVVKILFSNKDA
jgi:hypothetical protein